MAGVEAVPRQDRLSVRLGLLFCFLGLIAGHLVLVDVKFPAPWPLYALVPISAVSLALSILFWRWKWLRYLLLLLAACIQAAPYGPPVAWKKHPVEGAWVILGSLGLGLLLSIVYCAEILLRRLRLSLAAGVLFLVVFAFGMALVSQFFAWQSGAAAGGAPLTPSMLLLAAALLGLLLRAAVAASCAAPWLPGPLVQVTSFARADGLFLYRDLASPRLSVLLIYALSPLAWWLLGVALLGLWIEGGASFWRMAMLLALLLLLLARAVLGAWAAWGAWGEFREALGAYDKAGLKETRWYLFFSGLPLAGLICMYAFLFTAQRVQQDALAKEMERAEPELVAKMREYQGPPLEESQNAAPLYKQAAIGLPPLNDYGIISDAWRTPAAARWLSLGQAAMPSLAAATDLDRCAYLHDYGADIKTFDKSMPSLLDARNMANLLMLDARMAALDRDWPTVLKDTRRCLQIARHMNQQPWIISCMIGVAIEDLAVTGMLPALLWHQDGPAEDAVLAEAQSLLQDYESRRGAPVPRLIGIYRYESERRLGRANVVCAEAWPGDPCALSLMIGHPMVAWLEGENLRRWNKALHEAASSKYPLEECERVQSEFERVPSALKNHFLGSRAMIADADTLSEIRLAQAALAAVRFQMKYKRWPNGLQECVPEFLAEVPNDPYRPRDVLHFNGDPPRVWSASGPGLESSHLKNVSYGDELYGFFFGGYKEDKVFYLAAPVITYGASSRYLDSNPVVLDEEVRFLQDPDPPTRRMAAERIGWLSSRACPALPAVLHLAGDADPEFRMWSAFLLGTIARASPEALQALDRLKSDADPDVQRFARESLRWLKKAKK